MAEYHIDKETVTASRLDEDVVVIWGCTFQEVLKLLIGSYIVATLVIMPIAILFGEGFLGLIGVLIGGILFLMISANWVAKKKEGKPRRYYQHLIKIKLEKMGFGFSKVKLYVPSQKWTVRRLMKDDKK